MLTAPRIDLPTAAELRAGLAAVLGATGALGRSGVDLAVEDRSLLDEGTVPKEIVRVAARGRRLELFCKHGGPTSGPGAVRAGAEVEGAVYRAFVEPSGLPAPACLGTFRRSDGGTTLVLHRLSGAVRLSEAPARDVVTAARWLGEFHRRWSVSAELPAAPELRRLDADDLRGWATATARYAAALPEPPEWVEGTCDAVARAATELASGPIVVVHGEFTVKNVLSVDGVIHPADWEGAALGPGEYDLATLLERWPADLADEAVAAYRAARWPGGTDPDTERRLAVARLWVALRWLGERPTFAVRPDRRWRYDDLAAAADGLGLR